MASAYPKISDNEMNYYQFKAKQLCELMKEDEAWLKHCLQVSHEDCDDCSAKKPDPQDYKTVGIQVSPRKPLNTTSRPVVQTKAQKEEAIVELKNRLEKIELEINKIYATPLQNVKKHISESDPSIIKVPEYFPTSKSLEDQRSCFIQDSLKSSIAKINHLSPGKLKKSARSIKSSNSGYFLSHELQKKREVSRKAYLASLEASKVCKFQKKSQTNSKAIKLKQIPENVKQDSKKISLKNSAKRISFKTVPKTSKKSNTKLKNGKLNVAEDETLIKSLENYENEDEISECAVDDTLEDLLQQDDPDMNRIKFLKTADEQADPSEDKENPSNLFIELTVPKVPYNLDSAELPKLDFSLDVPNKPKTTNTKTSVELKNSYKSPASEKSKELSEEPLKTPSKMPDSKVAFDVMQPPKFVCEVSHIISVDPVNAKEIAEHTEEFWKYLSRISRTIKGNFNPWVFCNAIADSIVDDCIEDIAEELCNIPSALIKFLYIQEFRQHVNGA